MAKIIVDTARWPLVVIRYSPEFTEEEWSKHGDELGAVLTRRTRFVMLSDATRVITPPTAKQRRIASEKLRARRDEWARYCVASAFVTPSAIVRGVMTAINWASPPPFAQRVFATVAEGEAWLMSFDGFSALPHAGR